jgi:cytochrome c-type biogenesis protein
MNKGQILYGALLLFIYGLGRGIPVIAAGTFTGLVKSQALSRWSNYFERLSGVVLILIGLYFIWCA